MDVVHPLSNSYSHSCLDGVACTLFDCGVPANAAEVAGATVLSLSNLVSYRRADVATRDCIPMYHDPYAGLYSSSRDSW